MKKILTSIAILLLGGAIRAGAVMIEGVTPTGELQTVGLDSSGRFQVATASGNVQHVIVDGGTVTVKTDPLDSLNVNITGGSVSVVSTTPINVVFSTSASSCVSLVTNGGTLNGTSVIYPADPARKQGIICNTSNYSLGALEIRIGDSSGPILLPYGCFSPDGPGSFIGSLVGVSTTAVSYGYTYCK